MVLFFMIYMENHNFSLLSYRVLKALKQNGEPLDMNPKFPSCENRSKTSSSSTDSYRNNYAKRQ